MVNSSLTGWTKTFETKCVFIMLLSHITQFLSRIIILNKRL